METVTLSITLEKKGMKRKDLGGKEEGTTTR
jgi:hypothetical protein